jgi:hypothetical protein
MFLPVSLVLYACHLCFVLVPNSEATSCSRQSTWYRDRGPCICDWPWGNRPSAIRRCDVSALSIAIRLLLLSTGRWLPALHVPVFGGVSLPDKIETPRRVAIPCVFSLALVSSSLKDLRSCMLIIVQNQLAAENYFGYLACIGF